MDSYRITDMDIELVEVYSEVDIVLVTMSTSLINSHFTNLTSMISDSMVLRCVDCEWETPV